MHDIIIPKSLNESNFYELLDQCTQDIVRHERTLNFDFQRTLFITSYCLTLIVLLCNELIEKQGKKIKFTLSSTSKLNQCMYIIARLGFFESLPSIIKCYPYKPKFKRNFRGTNDSILEVTKVNNESEALAIIRRVEKAISNNTSYSEGQVLDISIMVSEMLQNIFYHSESQYPGLISIQKYPKFEYVQLVIADSGIGIPNSIRTIDNPKYKSMTDSETITEAIKNGVSRYNDQDRGEGLSRCVELAQKHDARLYIRSNEGFAAINFSARHGKYGDISNLNGTQIFVNFPEN